MMGHLHPVCVSNDTHTCITQHVVEQLEKWLQEPEGACVPDDVMAVPKFLQLFAGITRHPKLTPTTWETGAALLYLNPGLSASHAMHVARDVHNACTESKWRTAITSILYALQRHPFTLTVCPIHVDVWYIPQDGCPLCTQEYDALEEKVCANNPYENR